MTACSAFTTLGKNGKYITAIGVGVANGGIVNRTQRRAVSRNAAIVTARYNLLKTINKAKLKSGVTVTKATRKNPAVKTKLAAELKGAEIVRTKWTNDGRCIVKIRIPKNRLEQVMGVRFR